MPTGRSGFCSRISNAAASGSTNTAASSSSASGSAWRFTVGIVSCSANAPSFPRIPRTVRVGQCRPSPRAHAEHAPHARLISAATRRPTHLGASAHATTSATTSWPSTPRKSMYPRAISRSVLQIPARRTRSSASPGPATGGVTSRTESVPSKKSAFIAREHSNHGRARSLRRLTSAAASRYGERDQRASVRGREEAREMERALVSVSDKRGVVELARELARRGVEILSTGGTARALREAGLAVTEVAELHRLAGDAWTGASRRCTRACTAASRRATARSDRADLAAHRRSSPIDLVVVNLYPFEATVAQPGVPDRRGHREHRHRRPVHDPLAPRRTTRAWPCSSIRPTTASVLACWKRARAARATRCGGGSRRRRSRTPRATTARSRPT